MLVTKETKSVLTSCAVSDSGDACWTGWLCAATEVFEKQSHASYSTVKYRGQLQAVNSTRMEFLFVTQQSAMMSPLEATYPWIRKLKAEFFQEWLITKL